MERHQIAEVHQVDTSQPVWDIQLLGVLRANCGARVLEKFQTQKTAVLLAYLAFPPQRKHTREELIDLLWPDVDLEVGRKRLSQAISWLRTQLEFSPEMQGMILLADRQSIGLNPRVLRVDVTEFEAAASQAKIIEQANSDTASRVPQLEHAVSLYQGDLLQGHYEDWVLAKRQHLLTLYLSTLQILVQHSEQREDWERALEYVRLALTADPLAEELHCNLMRLLSASGQSEGALRHYQEWKRLLAKELGEMPSLATRTLVEQIRVEKSISLTKRLENAHTNTPEDPQPLAMRRPLTRFFGRDAEIASLRALLTTKDACLVSLTGTAGAGKTRLALEVAAQLAEDYQGAVWFVPLADITDPSNLGNIIRDTLRISPSETASSLEQIIKVLSHRPSLLILDNVEHLIEGAGMLVRSLLEAVGALKILVTSQQRLALDGEQEISLQSLPLPLWNDTRDIPRSQMHLDQLMQVESVRLFVDRAQLVHPAFAVTPQNAGAIAQICMRLEGLPLALELCAAWVQMLTPTQILTQLIRRFDLLVSRRLDITMRHRSLYAALEYSYLLLSPEIQQFLIQLSIFRGGWNLEAAASVCLEDAHTEEDNATDTFSTRKSLPKSLRALTLLTELRERSLLIAEEKTEPGADLGMRYRMLEALREFTSQQRLLVIEVPLRRRHAEYFLALAETAEPQLAGSEQGLWLSRLEAEHENLRAVLTWTLGTPSEIEPPRYEIGLRLVSALAAFWDVRGYLAEGQSWVKRLLAVPAVGEETSSSLAVRMKAMNAWGYMARGSADYPAAEAAARGALALGRSLGDDLGIATSLNILATIALFKGESETAQTLLIEVLQMGRSLQIPNLVARVLINLGLIATNREDWPLAWSLFSESLELLQTEGDQRYIGVTFNNLGLVARYQGDLPTAQRMLTEALAISHRMHDRPMVATALLNLGTISRLTGRFAKAWSVLQEASPMAQEAGNNRLLAWCIKEMGHLACAQNQWDLGTRLLSASERLRQTLGISFSPADPQELSRDVALAQSNLGDDVFRIAWQEGSLLLPQYACALATQAFESSAAKVSEDNYHAGYEI